MHRSKRVAALWVGLLFGVFSAAGWAQGPSAGDLRRSGTVRLEVTCKPELQEDFRSAVALLHSFFYEEARRRFQELSERDPECAMAWWGIAMTHYHPLWAPPTPEELVAGTAAVQTAKRIGGKTDLERGLIDAIDAYFRSDDEQAVTGPAAQSCHGPRAHGARAQAFRERLEALGEEFPDHLEVAIFHALALLGTAQPTDKTYGNQLAATAILEPLFERNPDHPGIPHYIIHAYDYAPLAARGLIAARRYDDIAPWVPHALHMPSHIYTRLGMWQDSIEANLASAGAARDYAARFFGAAATMDELHALDYLMFAYLQTEQDRKAGELWQRIQKLEKLQEINFASAYAIGAIPARYTLERRRWEEAAELPLPYPEKMTAYPYAVAHVEFARALGGARSGRLETTRQAIARLEELREQLKEPKFQWWTTQVEIQRLAAAGWLAFAEGHAQEAERLLREAVELESQAGTHPVTPGQILPAREQLADLLLELDRPREALAAYETSLEEFPNRFNGHFGAGRAAELAGEREAARRHYSALLEMAASGDGRRGELEIARKFEATAAIDAGPSR